MAVALPRKKLELKILKENIGILTKSIQWEYILEYGIDEFFVGRGVKLDSTEFTTKASTFWEQVSYRKPFTGRFKLPGELRTSAVYSRRSFKYPILIYRGPFPNPPTISNYVAFYIGLENGAAAFNGILSYIFSPNRLTTVIAGALPTLYSIGINNIFPPDENEHVFKIYHGEYISMFTIDNNIVAFVVQNETPGIIASSAPYVIIASRKLPESLAVLLEMLTDKTKPSEDAYVYGPSYSNIRVSESDGHHPIYMKLYKEYSNQPLEGMQISSTIYSHPFPLLYKHEAKILLLSSGSGTIDIEMYTQPGTTTIETYSYSANSALFITPPRVPVARLKISPSSSQTIQIASILLF
jgi:hypothetical protein